jgi:ribosomal protein S12 methylthiotransferase accessory factor
MLSDTISFDRLWKKMRGKSRASRSIASFIHFIERRLGARFVYDSSYVPYGRPELVDAFKIGDKLQRAGIIESYAPVFGLDDEPRIRLWRAQGLGHSKDVSGGMSPDSDEAALMATLAEGLERYIWSEEIDYFISPHISSAAQMAEEKNTVLPSRFVGFSEAQRAGNGQLTLSAHDSHLWIRGSSLTQGRDVFLPAQVVSPAYRKSPLSQSIEEQRIWIPITTGLATWPTKDGAVRAGALEVIERDAYMIMWLNQLTLPRINLAPWRSGDNSLDKLLADCERYRLSVHATRLLTDAPADTICVIVEDTTGNAPNFTIGLKAGHDIGDCIEGALLEALRSRQNSRGQKKEHVEDAQRKNPHAIKHMERLAYWNENSRAQMLSFLINGPFENVVPSAWANDTLKEHLERIRKWCIEKQYELISVSLGISKKNPLPWHIEMVVMPDLQPMHQDERFPYLGGERLRSIPEQFGYEARSEPFADEPHPFA